MKLLFARSHNQECWFSAGMGRETFPPSSYLETFSCHGGEQRSPSVRLLCVSRMTVLWQHMGQLGACPFPQQMLGVAILLSGVPSVLWLLRFLKHKPWSRQKSWMRMSLAIFEALVQQTVSLPIPSLRKFRRNDYPQLCQHCFNSSVLQMGLSCCFWNVLGFLPPQLCQSLPLLWEGLRDEENSQGLSSSNLQGPARGEGKGRL